MIDAIEAYRTQHFIFPCLCARCGHRWRARTFHPGKCPSCGQNLWYKPRNLGIDEFDRLCILETEECVIWPRSTIGGGYGRFTHRKEKHGKRTTFLVHRLSYERRIGPIPNGMDVCHSCDNPPCMNYRHLFAGTEEDNKNDKLFKKRHMFGERMNTAILNDSLVREIRSKYIFGSSTKGTFALAEEYGVNQKTIHSIVRRKTWTHI